MIFVTVGSMFPFDRLIRAVDDLAARGAFEEEVVAQIGDGRYEPRHIPFHRFMGKAEFDGYVSRASAVIAHAGAGTIETALERGKPLLVLPRLSRCGEHVNDHQLATAKKFEQLGHVVAAYDADGIGPMLKQLSSFVPAPRVADRARLAARIGRFIDAQRLRRNSE